MHKLQKHILTFSYRKLLITYPHWKINWSRRLTFIKQPIWISTITRNTRGQRHISKINRINWAPRSSTFRTLHRFRKSLWPSTTWQIMGNTLKKWLPQNFISLIRNIHINTRAKVRSEGEFGPYFQYKEGVRQGSKEGPILFNIFIDYVIKQALNKVANKKLGVKILYRLDGQWFDPSTADHEAIIECLLYADDVVIFAHSEANLQTLYDAIETTIT